MLTCVRDRGDVAGTSFDEERWSSFLQWENSAVKGDGKDQLEASSFALVHVDQKVVTRQTKWWTEAGVWQTDGTLGSA